MEMPMTRIAVVLASLSFALAGGALAAPAAPPSPATAAPANAATAAAPASATAAPAAKMAMPRHQHARHMAALRHDRGASQEGRETKALNLLEAKGYGSFENFHADGKDYAATVNANGRQFQVMIDPDSGNVTNRS
jgi:hypothetical protein